MLCFDVVDWTTGSVLVEVLLWLSQMITFGVLHVVFLKKVFLLDTNWKE